MSKEEEFKQEKIETKKKAFIILQTILQKPGLEVTKSGELKIVYHFGTTLYRANLQNGVNSPKRFKDLL